MKSMVANRDSASAAAAVFRSAPVVEVIGEGRSPTSIPDLGAKKLSVSGYNLEAYLNACSPTCHG